MYLSLAAPKKPHRPQGDRRVKASTRGSTLHPAGGERRAHAYSWKQLETPGGFCRRSRRRE
eukprot:6196026-Pleurochrysis_carterae.AAC.2